MLPMFALRDLGTVGLKCWYRLYDDPIFRRFVEPAVEVINGASRFREPQLIMAAMSLEAAGHYRDPHRRPRQRLEDQVRRCVAATGHDWSAIGTEKGIARAIAKTTNDLKHADRPNRPTGVELAVVTDLAKLIMRMQILDLLRIPGKGQLRTDQRRVPRCRKVPTQWRTCPRRWLPRPGDLARTRCQPTSSSPSSPWEVRPTAACTHDPARHSDDGPELRMLGETAARDVISIAASARPILRCSARPRRSGPRRPSGRGCAGRLRSPASAEEYGRTWRGPARMPNLEPRLQEAQAPPRGQGAG